MTPTKSLQTINIGLFPWEKHTPKMILLSPRIEVNLHIATQVNHQIPTYKFLSISSPNYHLICVNSFTMNFHCKLHPFHPIT